MGYNSSRPQETPIVIENLQEFYSAILEYYDELFPLQEDALQFFIQLQQEYHATTLSQPIPVCRFLGIGCATGALENKLAAFGLDITGIDKNPEMLETAKRRMKRGFSNQRFFEMSAIDMKRFLKKGSFHVISCINNMLPYIADETLIRKFFHDARDLLAPQGKLVIQTVNFDYLQKTNSTKLPLRNSIRVSLERAYLPSDDGLLALESSLELGSGRKIVLQKNTKLFPAFADRLQDFALEAGFTQTARFGDFLRSPWTDESPWTIFIFS